MVNRKCLPSLRRKLNMGRIRNQALLLQTQKPQASVPGVEENTTCRNL